MGRPEMATQIPPREIPQSPKVGMVSLGCPKALVDSERILTRLRADGYAMSADYAGADVVLVNTCGFLDSAKEESLSAIGEAMAENGRVIVTGCMGNEADAIRARFPGVLAVTGAHQHGVGGDTGRGGIGRDDGVLRCVRLRRIDQRQHAAAEAAAHHPRTVNAGHRPRTRRQRIERRRAHRHVGR